MKTERKQFGMDGWKMHYEWMVHCDKCNTDFLSDAKGQVHCNGEIYHYCPYCLKEKLMLAALALQ